MLGRGKMAEDRQETIRKMLLVRQRDAAPSDRRSKRRVKNRCSTEKRNRGEKDEDLRYPKIGYRHEGGASGA